jgi:hypothetical protein
MKRALGLLILLCGCYGHRSQDQPLTEHRENHGKLYFVENNYVHQWVYEDGTACGEVQGFKEDEGRTTFLATPWGPSSQKTYVRYEDAYKYISGICPNAIPVKVDQPK